MPPTCLKTEFISPLWWALLIMTLLIAAWSIGRNRVPADTSSRCFVMKTARYKGFAVRTKQAFLTKRLHVNSHSIRFPSKSRLNNNRCSDHCMFSVPKYRGTQRQFSENICSEDDLRSRIFGTFFVKFLACLPLLGFSNT